MKTGMNTMKFLKVSILVLSVLLVTQVTMFLELKELAQNELLDSLNNMVLLSMFMTTSLLILNISLFKRLMIVVSGYLTITNLWTF